eukprot:1147321-Pelagomonas_calceolata.AAC.1
MTERDYVLPSNTFQYYQLVAAPVLYVCKGKPQAVAHQIMARCCGELLHFKRKAKKRASLRQSFIFCERQIRIIIERPQTLANGFPSAG